jgi:hypothetical protein
MSLACILRCNPLDRVSIVEPDDALAASLQESFHPVLSADVDWIS